MNALALLLGSTTAIGVLLVIDGATRTPDAPRWRWQMSRTMRVRVVRASACGLLALVLTHWPVAAIALAILGWYAPDLLGARATREAATARTEAIASWAEMLRDTIASAHGLEATIAATAPIAPEPIRDEVVAAAIALDHEPLPVALTRLADELAHPIGDLIAAALSAAATGSVRDLSDLLGTLADTARDEAAMQLRVEAARARARTAVRVITGCTVVTAVGLVLLNPSYVDVYAGPLGQLTLATIAISWGIGLWWLARMSQFQTPERFLLPSPEVAP